MSKHEQLCIHLVGSVPLRDAEDVFRTVCGSIGAHVRRIPDGETGARRRWVGMISEILDRHPAFEPDPGEPPFVMKLASGRVHRELTRLKFRSGIDPKSVHFETGYAAMAIDSFAIYARLQSEGVIPQHVKFQIAIPSPLAPAYNYIGHKSRTAFLDVFCRHMQQEVGKIAAALPNERLSLQWDVLQEILIWEGYFPDRPSDYQQQVTSTLSQIGEAVPVPIELGYHLCYGSPKDEHLVQPRDARIMTQLMRETLASVRRPIHYFHFPVPKHRLDAEFYRPLSALKLPDVTELYVGLAHLDDAAGNRIRLDLARQFTKVSGVASECGWGRGNPSRVAGLLETLRALVSA